MRFYPPESAASSGADVFISTCSGLVAPAMTLATPGFDSSQQKASSRMLRPLRAQKASSRSSVCQLLPYIAAPRAFHEAKRVPAAGSRRAGTCRSAVRWRAERTAAGRDCSLDRRQQLLLDVAHQQAVLVLAGDEGVDVHMPRDVHCASDHLPGRHSWSSRYSGPCPGG